MLGPALGHVNERRVTTVGPLRHGPKGQRLAPAPRRSRRDAANPMKLGGTHAEQRWLLRRGSPYDAAIAEPEVASPLAAVVDGGGYRRPARARREAPAVGARRMQI